MVARLRTALGTRVAASVGPSDSHSRRGVADSRAHRVDDDRSARADFLIEGTLQREEVGIRVLASAAAKLGRKEATGSHGSTATFDSRRRVAEVGIEIHRPGLGSHVAFSVGHRWFPRSGLLWVRWDHQAAVPDVNSGSRPESVTRQWRAYHVVVCPGPAHERSFERILRGPSSCKSHRAGFFDAPPGLEDAGEGYVRTPRWPEGEYLARIAPDAPATVARIATAVPLGDNPRVGGAVIAVARALPVELGVQLVPRVAAWFRVPLALLVLSRDAIVLDRHLIESGQIGHALELFTALLEAATGPQGQDWELEQVLELADAFPEAALPQLTGVLQTRLARALEPGVPTERYSSIWLPRVDRVPRLGRDRPGRLVHALYRALLRVPARNADRAVGGLLRDERRVLRRIALAVAADHAARIGPIDALIGAPERWDQGETRYEFRRLVRNRCADASEAAREQLLAYAERADEVTEILASWPDGAEGADIGLLTRRWRTRLLGAVWERVPAPWQARLGPLVAGEPLVEERPEPEAHYISDSPYTLQDLAGKTSRELVSVIGE